MFRFLSILFFLVSVKSFTQDSTRNVGVYVGSHFSQTSFKFTGNNFGPVSKGVGLQIGLSYAFRMSQKLNMKFYQALYFFNESGSTDIIDLFQNSTTYKYRFQVMHMRLKVGVQIPMGKFSMEPGLSGFMLPIGNLRFTNSTGVGEHTIKEELGSYINSSPISVDLTLNYKLSDRFSVSIGGNMFINDWNHQPLEMVKGFSFTEFGEGRKAMFETNLSYYW